jgi:predicted phosphoribosyltransferase
MTFESREDAGRQLGLLIREKYPGADLVLGLPRGGVVVAAEVARVLHRRLDVLVVRKIGHPLQREFAVGAMAEKDVIILDESVIGTTAAVRDQLSDVIEDEMRRLIEYERKFRSGPSPDLSGKTVLIVDDGLATGATMEAGVLSARKQGAASIVVAVPVASTNGVARLERVADAVVALLIDPEFDAVGRYYRSFSQTTDEEVVALLKSVEYAPQ